jgi:hypothetical protein
MSHNEDIDRIRYESTVERIRKYKIIETDSRTWYVLETPMEEVWPGGDPVPRDRETLVRFVTEEEYNNGIKDR